jgi:hypothetical protein
MNAPEFVKSMLVLLRRLFLADATDKDFFQEKPTLELAITHPAAWLEESGVAPTIGIVRKALMTVIDTIKKHGKKVDRFSVYFLHCVQLHMNHHGEEYRQALKAPRPIGSLLGRTMKAIKDRPAGEPDPGAVLVAVNKTLRRRRRIQKVKSTAHELDLFTRCNPLAPAVQRPRSGPEKFPKPLQIAPDSQFPPPTASELPGDS